MKKRWILNLIALTLTGLHAQWSGPVTISEGFAPDFDINPDNGHLHIVTVSNDPPMKGVVYTETDEFGAIVLPPAVIPGTSMDVEYWNFGATVAVDQSGFPHVCFRVPRGNYYYDVYYTRKTYSGWLTNPRLILSNKKRAYMVRMDIDSQDNVHIAVGYLAENNTSIDGPIAYYRVYNNEIKHSIMDICPLFTYYRLDNRFEMTVDSDDAIHIIAGCPGIPSLTYEGPITYFRSTDGGNTFDTGVDVHNSKCYHRNGSPDVAADNSGCAHIIYGAKIDMDRNDSPSLRYVRFRDGEKLIDKPITYVNDVKPWGYPEGYNPEHGKNYGLGSIAVSNDGAIVMAAYVTNPSFYSGTSFFRGDLYVTLSSDSGETWFSRELLAENVSNNEGRNVHLLRSYKNHFYVIYPHNEKPKKIKLRYLRDFGDNPPVADAGGPYHGQEGYPLTLDASGTTDSGQNPGIVQYEWDLDNNGEYELSHTQPVLETTVGDDYYATIRIRVTDHAGHTDEAETTLLVDNVPPDVHASPDTTIDEGQTLSFHCIVDDPGSEDSHTFLWKFGDGYTDDQQSALHTYTNDGEFQVIAEVTDKDEGVGKDTLSVIVNNVPPVADAGGSYSGALYAPILFSGSATDVSTDDMQNLTFRWDLDNDSHFETLGQSVSYSFNSEGEFIVWMKVDDNKDADIDSAIVTVSNDPPVISAFENQMIMEGGSFNPVMLDQFVDDPDQTDSELNWSVSGFNQLDAIILNRILTVSTPNEDWYGSEKMLLTVSDTGGLTDTAYVRFTITPINDPPLWTNPVPDFVTDEDVPLYVSLDSLRQWVADVDDPDMQLIFSISTQQPVNIQMVPEDQCFQVLGEEDWNGEAALMFSVTDTAGLSRSDTSMITIISVPDHPADFQLIEPMLVDSTDMAWPDSILFIWQSTYDRDNPEGFIYYTWTMRNLRGFEQRSLTLFDTTAVYYPESSLSDGQYIWNVTAYTAASGLSTQSQNNGFVIVGKMETGIFEALSEIPETFDLKQNYPNPFNPITQIGYHIPEPCHVEISIYNTLGQKVRELVRGSKSPGIYMIVWNGVNDLGQKVPTGIYICKMITNDGQLFYRKMMLIQ